TDALEIYEEIDKLKKLVHPKYVKFVGSWAEGEKTIWIATEHCEYGSVLSTFEATQKGVNEEQLSYILRNVLDVLIYFHSTQRLHRNVKSENVFLCANGDVKMGDFKISASLDKTISNGA
ncbi:MAG: putative tyrosine-protein kinase Abl, partial [Streblomastix strix]